MVTNLNNLDSVPYKRSLVIGTLLGDAYSRQRSKATCAKAEFTIAHSLKQADLVEWKATEIGRLYGKVIRVNYNSTANRASFHIAQSGRLRIIHRWFHRNHQKVVSKKIRFMDHPIGLSMLLCDDGSVLRRKKSRPDGSTYYLSPCITIATHGFDRKSVGLLLEWIENLCGAKGYINPERRLRSGQIMDYPRIRFNVENSRCLWNYAGAWIPQVPSMSAKFSFARESFSND